MKKIVDIINALEQGGELAYVAGRFGGYILTLNGRDYDVRNDYARKAVERMGLSSKFENGNLVWKIK